MGHRFRSYWHDDICEKEKEQCPSSKKESLDAGVYGTKEIRSFFIRHREIKKHACHITIKGYIDMIRHRAKSSLNECM
jgi:hypothetical protein